MRLEGRIRTFPKTARIAIFALVATATLVMTLAATIGLLHGKQLQQVRETRVLLLQHRRFWPPSTGQWFSMSSFFAPKKECQEAKAQIPVQPAIAITINWSSLVLPDHFLISFLLSWFNRLLYGHFCRIIYGIDRTDGDVMREKYTHGYNQPITERGRVRGKYCIRIICTKDHL